MWTICQQANHSYLKIQSLLLSSLYSAMLSFISSDMLLNISFVSSSDSARTCSAATSLVGEVCTLMFTCLYTGCSKLYPANSTWGLKHSSNQEKNMFSFPSSFYLIEVFETTIIEKNIYKTTHNSNLDHLLQP
jgi:hypothetical protein